MKYINAKMRAIEKKNADRKSELRLNVEDKFLHEKY